MVREGTGAVEALGLAGLRNDDGGPRLPGMAVPLPPDHPDAPAALAARDRLPGWDRTAAAVLAAVEGTAG